MSVVLTGPVIRRRLALLLAVFFALFLLLGMVMEPGAILTLMLPVLLPIANGLGLNLVHFGVMIVLNLMIGQVTPPFGVCLFVISDVNKVRLESLYKSILPFLIPLIATLALVTYLPYVVTWLPNLLLG
jgi:TRAP-type C4-dicarboxylate transport system permease large subunit